MDPTSDGGISDTVSNVSQQRRPSILSQIIALLDARFPRDTAEAWDAVGLVAGDPHRPVERVMFAVDPVAAVIDEAIEWGADLLVTHHPLLLRPVHSVAATDFKGAAIHRLIEAGCALYVAHTNADIAERGVADALAQVLDLTDTKPLVPTAADDGIGLGRVGKLSEPVTLETFARRVAARLPATEQGIRVAGDLDALIETVAVLGGSGDSFFDEVIASGADAYVTSDLKHHPVSEMREQLDGGPDRNGAGRPFLVDTAHFASEWPWLRFAADDLMSDARASGTTVEVRVSSLCTDPWTGHFPSTTADQRPER